VAYRFSGPGQPYEGLVTIGADGERKRQWNGQVRFVEEHLLDPLKWKGKPLYDSGDGYKRVGYGPMRIFVNSMSDLFHPNVKDEWIDRIFAVMALCPQHTFQVLTKRPERMLAYLSASNIEARIAYACVQNGQPIAPGYFSMAPGGGDLWEVFGAPGKLRFVDERVNGGVPCSTGKWSAADFDKWPLPNVQPGVSVEDQKTADERIPLLLQTPAAARFISAEPLLGEINMDDFLYSRPGIDTGRLNRLHWVIVGGESDQGKKKARPMHPDWARGLRDQCQSAGVPFFFKQWGEWGPGSVNLTSGERVFRQFTSYLQWTHKANTWINGGICLDAHGKQMKTGGDMKAATYPVTVTHRVGKKAAGSLLDGREWKEFPTVGA
jgi:protein gp37